MARKPPEPVQVVKQRRDAALNSLVHGVPYVQFLGIEFDRRGDELTAIMPFDDKLIGNPMLPAIHGGAIAGFLETTEGEFDAAPCPIGVDIDLAGTDRLGDP